MAPYSEGRRLGWGPVPLAPGSSESCLFQWVCAHVPSGAAGNGFEDVNKEVSIRRPRVPGWGLRQWRWAILVTRKCFLGSSELGSGAPGKRGEDLLTRRFPFVTWKLGTLRGVEMQGNGNVARCECGHMSHTKWNLLAWCLWGVGVGWGGGEGDLEKALGSTARGFI